MYVQNYLDWKATYAPRASVNYRVWLERFHEVTGNKKITDIKIGDIIKFRHWMDKRYQPGSIKLATIVLGNFFKFYKLQGINCISPELIRAPKVVSNSYPAITFEEYTLILSLIHPTNFWELQKLCMVRLLYETGCRVSEIADLNWSDIDPLKMNTAIKTKKNGNTRQIFWSVETHIFIKEFLKLRREINSTPALFIGLMLHGEYSHRITPRTIQRILKELVRLSGLTKKITPHSFRHGKAHHILDLGGNPKDVQAILGHCNPVSSFTYLQWNDKEFESRAKMFV